MINVIIQT